MHRLARRAIMAWEHWRTRRRLHRAYPEARRIEAEIAERRARHAPVADLLAEQRDIMTGAMRGTG